MEGVDPNIGHGLAGFQSGCRCDDCFSAESGRMRRIGRSEASRWARINERADRHWGRRVQDDRETRPSNEQVRWSQLDIELALDTSISVYDVAELLGRSADAVETVRRRYRDRR